MYDDILGPYEEKKKAKKPKNRVNLKNQVCYDCGNTFEECECEEGFSLEDIDLDEEESKLGAIDENEEDPWDGADMEDTCKDDCGCDDDGGCIGVGCLNDCEIPPEQDIATIEPMSDAEENRIWQLVGNDQGRNCEGQCKTCDDYDCMYQYLD